MSKELDDKIDHALDELLNEVSVILASRGSRPMDFDVLKTCYDTYHSLLHERMKENLAALIGTAKPGPNAPNPRH